jgi:mannosyltransferase OCH1-like enzyme
MAERLIPRITHQTWFQGWDVIPDKFQKNADNLAKLNPNYTHMKWDETSLRHECGKLGHEVVAKFDSFPHMIQKIDLGRYVVIYNYGGITVDTDMVPLKPIDETPGIQTGKLIVSGHAFPHKLFSTANNALIVAQPQHPFLKDLIHEIVKKEIPSDGLFNIGPLQVLITTGPYIFNSVLSNYRDSVIILDNIYFEPCAGIDILCFPGKEAIMDHQHYGSWIYSGAKTLGTIVLVLFYLIIFLLPIGALYGLFVLFQKYRLSSFLKQFRRK